MGAAPPVSISAAEMPLPANAGVNATFYPVQITCPSASSCYAVGEEKAGSTGQWPAIATYAAGSWSTSLVTLPAGAAGPTTPSDHDPSFTAISCTSASFCAAVGNYQDPKGVNWSFIDTLSSGSWTVTQAPEPANAGTEGAGTQFAQLESLSCPSAGSCVAAGDYEVSASSRPGLIETLSSGSWAASEAGIVPGQLYDVLESISCASSTNCVAVGHDQDSNGFHAIIEKFAAGSWSGSLASLPSGASSSGSDLSSVSCPAAGSSRRSASTPRARAVTG